MSIEKNGDSNGAIKWIMDHTSPDLTPGGKFSLRAGDLELGRSTLSLSLSLHVVSRVPSVTEKKEGYYEA